MYLIFQAETLWLCKAIQISLYLFYTALLIISYL